LSSQDSAAAAPVSLRVHALFRLPEVRGAVPDVASVERPPAHTLTEVYHDTEDLRLFRWGVTLLRREGGADGNWRLQVPLEAAGVALSEEVFAPLADGSVGDVPEVLSDVVRALTRESDVIPVATLRTERTPFVLHGRDGEPAAELVDDTVSVLDGEHVAARFRSLSVTPLGDDPAVAHALVELLIAHGAVPGPASQAAAALGPRASAAPDVVLRPVVCPEDPAADAVRAHIALQVTRFLVQDLRVRLDLPDSVHQMRVAARRLRSGLKVFGPLLDEEWSRQLRTELGWAAGELGRVRDTEVMLARLDDHAGELPPADAQLATEAVERVLRAELAQARTAALASLRSKRHIELLVALVDAVELPRMTELANRSCAEVLPPMVDKSFQRLSKDVAALHPDSAAEPWHETRIAAKKARYAAELVTPVFGVPAKRLAKALADVTENLGDHQDCYVAEQELRVIAARDDTDGATGFALGLLHAAEEEREMALRQDFVRLWPSVRKLFRKTVLA